MQSLASYSKVVGNLIISGQIVLRLPYAMKMATKQTIVVLELHGKLRINSAKSNRMARLENKAQHRLLMRTKKKRLLTKNALE